MTDPRTVTRALRGFTVAVTWATVLVLAGCGPGPDQPALLQADSVPTPAAPGSGEPSLVVSPEGVVYLSWLEPSDAGHALKFTSWEGQAWGEARTIIDRPGLFVNWADFPSLAVFGDGVLAAHWLEKSGPGVYSYDVRMALSRDGGATWGDDIIPHRDGVRAEHGFVAMTPWQGQLAVMWLDGRETVHGDPMTLRFSTVTARGALGHDVRLDASVCDCCQTALAIAGNGLLAVYRDRAPGEIRDIYAARYVGGRWTEGRPVHEDGWVIPGCPVNGPAVAARGDTVAVAWFTASPGADTAQTETEIRTAGERGRALVAFSLDGGETFGEPVRVDDGESMGRVDIVLLRDGSAVVSWLERTALRAQVRARRVDPTGASPSSIIAGTEALRATGFPRMVRVADWLVFAWTMPGAAGGVRTAIAALPREWSDPLNGAP
jgi:hypothetical protein